MGGTGLVRETDPHGDDRDLGHGILGRLRLNAGFGYDIGGLGDRERFAALEPRCLDAEPDARARRQAVEPDILCELAGLLAVEGPEVRSDGGAGPGIGVEVIPDGRLMAEELPAAHIGGMRDGGEVQDDVMLTRREIDADGVDGKRVGIARSPTVAEAGEIDPTEPVDRLLFFHGDDLRRCLRLLCLADHGRVTEPEFAAARDHPLVEGEHRRAALIGSRGRDDRAPVQLRDLLGVHEREVLEERHRLDLGEVGHSALTEPVAPGVVIGELVGILDDKEATRTHLVVAELVVPVVG